MSHQLYRLEHTTDSDTPWILPPGDYIALPDPGGVAIVKGIRFQLTGEVHVPDLIREFEKALAEGEAMPPRGSTRRKPQ